MPLLQILNSNLAHFEGCLCDIWTPGLSGNRQNLEKHDFVISEYEANTGKIYLPCKSAEKGSIWRKQYLCFQCADKFLCYEFLMHSVEWTDGISVPSPTVLWDIYGIWLSRHLESCTFTRGGRYKVFIWGHIQISKRIFHILWIAFKFGATAGVGTC